MRFAILGTGHVRTAIGSKLAQLDHQVMMGARSATNEAPAKWAAANGSLGGHGNFAAAARYREVIINVTAGSASLRALGTVAAG